MKVNNNLFQLPNEVLIEDGKTPNKGMLATLSC